MSGTQRFYDHYNLGVTLSSQEATDHRNNGRTFVKSTSTRIQTREMMNSDHAAS